MIKEKLKNCFAYYSPELLCVPKVRYDWNVEDCCLYWRRSGGWFVIAPLQQTHLKQKCCAAFAAPLLEWLTNLSQHFHKQQRTAHISKSRVFTEILYCSPIIPFNKRKKHCSPDMTNTPLNIFSSGLMASLFLFAKFHYINDKSHIFEPLDICLLYCSVLFCFYFWVANSLTQCVSHKSLCIFFMNYI